MKPVNDKQFRIISYNLNFSFLPLNASVYTCVRKIKDREIISYKSLYVTNV